MYTKEKPSFAISNILGMLNFPFNKKVTHIYRKDLRETNAYNDFYLSVDYWFNKKDYIYYIKIYS